MIRRWRILTVRDYAAIAIGGFFGISINIGFFFLGLEKAPSINAPIISSSAPVFIYFLSIFLLKEKANGRMFWGMMLSLMGVLTIILSPIVLAGSSLTSGSVIGNCFFLVATFGYVVHTLVNKKLVSHINIYQLTGIQFFIGALTFVPFMAKELGSWNITQLNPAGWTGIVFGVFLSSALAYFLYNYAMKKLKAQETGIFIYIDPIAAVLVAVPLIGEYPNLYFFIGALLVFGGIFVAERRIHYHPIHWWRKFATI